MEITMQYVAQALKEHGSQLTISHTDTRLSSVFFGAPPEEWAGDILYVVDAGEEEAVLERLLEKQVNVLVCNSPGGLAQECTANVLSLPPPVDSKDIFPIVQDIFFVEQRLANCTRRLFGILASGGSIQRIVDCAYCLLGNPILVIDAGFKVVAANWDVTMDDRHSQRILKDRYLDQYDMRAINFDRTFERLHKSEEPFLLQNPNYKYDRIIVGLNLEQKNVGHAVLVGRMKALTEYDVRGMAIVRDVLIQRLHLDEFIRNSRGFHYEYLIADLLDGKITTGRPLSERFEYVNLRFEALIYVSVVELERSEHPVNHTFIRDALEQLLLRSHAILYNGQIVLLTTRKESDPLTQDELKRLREFCQEKDLFCGMSNYFRNITDLPTYYKQALRAIELGTADRSSPSLFRYKNYALAHFAGHFLQKENAEAFCHPVVLDLIRQDEQNNTELARTLHGFLRHERNITKTAKFMHLHRNTLIYRLNKLREMEGLNLEDDDSRQYILASFQILTHRPLE